MYSSIPENIWDLECIPNYNCNGGKNTILGVPWNAGTYFLFYNKALLAKAGISGPPATYDAAVRRLQEAQREGHHGVRDGRQRRL